MKTRRDLAASLRSKTFQSTLEFTHSHAMLALKMFDNWIDIFDKLYQFTSELFINQQLGGKLIMYGNGGSAADCDHIIGEFRGRFMLERPSINAICLSDSIATMTAIGNDYGYEHVFRRQLDGITQREDSIIALTTSGTSKNIINSIYDVKRRFPDINSLIITGEMGQSNPDFKYHIQIPIKCDKPAVARIQEMTVYILHTMCGIFDSLWDS